MSSTVPLLLAAASVGALHMSAPDHWATLTILGRAAGWSQRRLLGIGVMTAAGHAGLSILLGFAIVLLGSLLSQQFTTYVTLGIGVVMLVGGLFYGARELVAARRRKTVTDMQKGPADDGQSLGSRFRYFAVLGAALSPDLSILPIFLLATPLGLGFALATAAVFATATVAALLLFLILAAAGLAKAFERFPPEYNDSMVGFVIAAVGLYVIIVG